MPPSVGLMRKLRELGETIDREPPGDWYADWLGSLTEMEFYEFLIMELEDVGRMTNGLPPRNAH